MSSTFTDGVVSNRIEPILWAGRLNRKSWERVLSLLGSLAPWALCRRAWVRRGIVAHRTPDLSYFQTISRRLGDVARNDGLGCKMAIGMNKTCTMGCWVGGCLSFPREDSSGRRVQTLVKDMRDLHESAINHFGFFFFGFLISRKSKHMPFAIEASPTVHPRKLGQKAVT